MRTASVESRGDYSAYNVTKGGGVKSFFSTNLTEMTITEVMDNQAKREIFAAGRYQMIPSTLSAGVNYLKLDKSLMFNSDVQDKLFNEYLIVVKRPAIINYLTGNGTAEKAVYDWAKEFASAGVMKSEKLSGNRVAKGGESYYAGDGYNKAFLAPDAMIKSLRNSK